MKHGWARTKVGALLAFSAVFLGDAQSLESLEQVPAGAPTVVGSVRELRAALRAEATERWIRIRRGDYPLEEPLVVPPGTTLEGEGTIRFDADGLASGFEPGTETVLFAAPDLEGDLVSLDDAVTLRGLRLVDSRIAESPERSGNTVILASRSPGSNAAATIRECEIDTGSSPGIGREGPVGNAVLTMTRNPGGGRPPDPHDGARVRLTIERSIVRARGGGQAIFAINFAPRSVVDLELRSNRIAGALCATGGVSRPDAVESARTVVRSRDNVYGYAEGFAVFGWQLLAGSSPHAPNLGAAATIGNSIDVTSEGDRIEGFRNAILAVAGRRIEGSDGEVTGNRAALAFGNLTLRSASEGGADLVLLAALAGYAPENGSHFPVGEANRLEATFTGVHGSGARRNVYSQDEVQLPPGEPRQANRLVIKGSADAFRSSNPDISPSPPAECFESPLLENR